MKNKTSKTLFLVIPLLLLCSAVVFANDTYLGSAGGNVFRENQFNKGFISYAGNSNAIQMVKESINIKVERDSYYVFCKFWFYNAGPKDFVFFGFPNSTNSETNASGSLRNFKTIINGKDIAVTLVTRVTDAKDEYPRDSINWFSWVSEVPSNDTLLIFNTYSGELGGMAGGGALVSYIIGTGSTWNGPIKEGTVVFDFSHAVSSYYVFKSDYFKPIIYQDSIIYKFNNYKPLGSEILEIKYLPYWKEFDNYSVSQIIKDKNLTKNDYRLMKNEIYARHGYIFKDKYLNKYFSGRKWYKPNSNYKVTMLNQYEKNMVKYLSELEIKVDK